MCFRKILINLGRFYFNASSFLFKDGVARPMTAVHAAGYTKAAMRGMVCRNRRLPEGDVILQFAVLG